MNIDVLLDKGAYMPEKGHTEDAGYDLRTICRVIVPARGSATIDTGVHVAIPKGFYGKLESKSGLNVKHGVVCLGGVIDAGYTGSIVVKLYNLSNEDYEFQASDKIVQIIFQPCANVIFEEIGLLNETARGNNGFGSTGR